MTTMVLANPVVGTASESVTAAGAYHQKNYAYGDCATDTLTIASPGSIGSPVVCGVNTDQHSNLAKQCTYKTLFLNTQLFIFSDH